MEKPKRGRPKKNADPAEVSTTLQEQSAQQFNAALDQMALARDYAAAIENGGLGPQDFAELAREAHKAICDAGKRIERNLLRLGFLPEGASGWFIPDMKRELVETAQ